MRPPRGRDRRQSCDPQGLGCVRGAALPGPSASALQDDRALWMRGDGRTTARVRQATDLDTCTQSERQTLCYAYSTQACNTVSKYWGFPTISLLLICSVVPLWWEDGLCTTGILLNSRTPDRTCWLAPSCCCCHVSTAQRPPQQRVSYRITESSDTQNDWSGHDMTIFVRFPACGGRGPGGVYETWAPLRIKRGSVTPTTEHPHGTSHPVGSQLQDNSR